MNKTEIIAKLEALEIAFDPSASKKELLALLPKDQQGGSDEDEADEDGIIVKDPEVLLPKQLPLVVTLPEGASKAQQEYVKILNAYAYQNPRKWAIKKEGLLKTLRSLKNAPDPVENENQKLTIGRKLPGQK